VEPPIQDAGAVYAHEGAVAGPGLGLVVDVQKRVNARLRVVVRRVAHAVNDPGGAGREAQRVGGCSAQPGRGASMVISSSDGARAEACIVPVSASRTAALIAELPMSYPRRSMTVHRFVRRR